MEKTISVSSNEFNVRGILEDSVEMRIGKRDLLTVAVLSIVFFSVASMNLGMTRTPTTIWQTNEEPSFYIDFGELQSVRSIYILVKFGAANITVYTGSPDKWIGARIHKIPYYGTFDYYRWNQIDLNRDTQYLRFDFQDASIEIAEIAVLNNDNQKVTLKAVTERTTTDPNLPKLIDEQDVVQCPPTYMSEAHFDEKYFVRTAEDYLNLRIPYEWTHPPLGKLILASGISLFGYNPFGWRITGVVFATLIVALMYLVGKELFGTWIGGFAPAFLVAFDFMNFAMGRMATVDVYVAFFSLTSQFFFLIYLKGVLKNGWKTSVRPLFLAVLFFALGFSTKWIVLFGFAGQLVILLVLRLREVVKLEDGLSKKVVKFLSPPFFSLYFFLLLAIFVYFLTYVPDMILGRGLFGALNLQGAMYNYHSMLVSTHTYASKWYTWPLIFKPVLLFRTTLPNDVTSVIVAMGNPAVWWAGFTSIVLAVERAIRKKEFACIFITVLFFFQWLPYALISRTTYLYHFYVSVPFLCLAATYFINKYWSNKWGKLAAVAYFAVVVVVFGLFYPVISGVPVSTSLLDSLKWLGSWGF